MFFFQNHHTHSFTHPLLKTPFLSLVPQLFHTPATVIHSKPQSDPRFILRCWVQISAYPDSQYIQCTHPSLLIRLWKLITLLDTPVFFITFSLCQSDTMSYVRFGICIIVTGDWSERFWVTVINLLISSALVNHV
jgi:hypothetical protein